ncbi:hypothetical protein B0H12DRAFT_1072968 [Mycena haematopus]|nr:hypothetical protein B0H12DRAFT_1072968 [Mycena haematopus]
MCKNSRRSESACTGIRGSGNERTTVGRVPRQGGRGAQAQPEGEREGRGTGRMVGFGLGAAVGTLVGAIASIPTTGVGFLVGVPVGWIHGPWVGRGGKKNDKHLSGDGTEREAEEVEAKEGGQSNGPDEAEDSDETTDERTHRAILEAVEATDKLENENAREHVISSIEEPHSQLRNDEDEPTGGPSGKSRAEKADKQEKEVERLT